MLRVLRAVVTVSVIATALFAQDDAASRRAAIESMYPVMVQALEAKAFGRARNICEQAILWEPQNPIHHYNLACVEAQAGRLPQALGALELSAVLGFNDPRHLQNDPDLAPLHRDPKFPEIVRRVTGNAIAGSAVAGIAIPDTTSRPKPAPAAAGAAAPAPNAFPEGRPIGLFSLTRLWPGTGSLEKAVWYFAPDGTVYQNLEFGFSSENLAAHRGPKGTVKVAGDKLEVTWNDGKQTRSVLKRSSSGTGFSWNAGLFSAVAAFASAAEAAGVYEGGESLAVGGDRALVSKRLELRADGSFRWSGVSFASAPGEATRVDVSGQGAASGRWQLDGYSLQLTDESGAVIRRIAFPYDDPATPIRPDRLFFGGLLYKRQ